MSIKATSFIFHLFSVFTLLVLLFSAQGFTPTVSAGSDVWTSNGPEGRNTRALAIGPATQTILYAGTEDGGVAKVNNSATASTTVTSIARVNPNPTGAASVSFTVTFSRPVIGVDIADFSLATSYITGASITSVNGLDATYTVTVNTGTPHNSSNGLININTASLLGLDTLPGIGPTTAQNIIDYRTANGPFLLIEDIMNVLGIGPTIFENIKDLITVDGSYLRLDVPVSVTIADLAGNSLVGLPYTSGETYTINDNSNPFTNCAAQTQIPATECDVLVALYNSTNGASWANNTGWLQTNTPCSWYGIVCDNGGNLTQLGLASNSLTGAIPPELGTLIQLSNLQLWDNHLSGSIPAQLGNLTSLTSLALSRNQLSGSVPVELGNLIQLSSLQLWDNQLSGSIPAQLGNLTNLVRLDLSRNQLTGSIPVELGNLTALEALHLTSNQLTGSIPVELGNLTALKELDLTGNQLTGSIPAQLGNLTKLEWLALQNNQLTGSIPVEFGNLTGLVALKLYRNQLSGSIPTQLGNLTKLVELHLDHNQLTGSIPLQLGNLINLTWLSLDNNQLAGFIPTQLGNLTKVGILWLNNNQLTGSIPTQLGNMTKLGALYLDNNQLSGPIPTQLGNLLNLWALKLSFNQLTGSIPSQLSNLTNLTKLELVGNQLSGSIPPQLGKLKSLTYLDLTGNQLSGSIPTELGNLTQLKTLCLVANELTGSIPPELGNLTNLTLLQLQWNQLTGSIPPELGNLTNLTWLDLSYNQLTGSVPLQLGNLTNLIDLILNSNQLSGIIPTQLSNLTQLSWLSLYDNQLTGSIPPELGELINLEILYLSGNRLAGEFPASITNLVNLNTFTFDCWITSANPAVMAFVDSLVPGWQNSICPVVSSITRGDPNPTGSISVDFIVTFSEPVVGVDTSDFTLKTVGIFSAAVSAVSGSGHSYIVTINTGTGNTGTISLDVRVGATVIDLDGNLLANLPFARGDFYIVNKLIPNPPTLRSPRSNLITNDTTPTFWWTTVRGGETYEIEFAWDNAFTSLIDSKIINGSSYTVSSPFVLGDYFWHVRAYSSSNQPGVWSSTRTFTIDTSGPSAPVLSFPANNAFSKRTPIFRWLGVASAVSYEFQYDNDLNFSSPIYTTAVRGNFRRPPAMGVGFYYWHVRAKDVVGNWSGWSAPFTINITGQ